MERLHQADAIRAEFAPSESSALPDRLPWPLAALVIGGASVGLWTLLVVVFRALA